MDKLLGRKPATSRDPADRVVPLHFFENSLLVQGNNMAVLLVFDDVLDPEKLRQSLEGLIKRDGWQRLGGRLAKTASGKIKWHIPYEFTASRPALRFSHVDHNIPAADHPAASRIPSPTPSSSDRRPAVVGDPDDLAPLAREPGYTPGGIADYLFPADDRPVLGLCVHSFTDKTVVVLQWQHVAFDALGTQYVVENWARVLGGREHEVPTPCGLDKDHFDALARGAAEGAASPGRPKGGVGVYAAVGAWENRIVCVPEAYWRRQLDKALDELRAEAAEKGEDVSKVFLTEGDILAAWTVR